MPCSWADRETHKPGTKTQAKPTQTIHLFQMTILRGMQRGGQKRLHLQKPVFSCPRRLYVFLYTNNQMVGSAGKRYSAMLVTE